MINKPMNDFFESLEHASRDPILGLTEQFNSDKCQDKVNLGVGVYYNEYGKVPLLQAVQEAELSYVKSSAPRGYLPIEGLPEYNRGTQALLFGKKSDLVEQKRVLTVQTLGGTGALKIGADFLKQFLPKSKVLISDPSWENHRALFKRAGFFIETYPYYDNNLRILNFEGMISCLKKASPKSIVVLHACCHNPTGIDPRISEWEEIIKTIRNNELIPFLDMAYQGLGENLDADASVVRMFSESVGPTFISSSFSKSFSLYGERVGALTIVTKNNDESSKVLSHLKHIIRTTYSNPPKHGAAIISSILNSSNLFSLWKIELEQMKNRIYLMRKMLAEKLEAKGIGNFHFIMKQRGMFSYSGLNESEVHYLRRNHGIYIIPNGRICIAALNQKNIEKVAHGIASTIIENRNVSQL